MFSLAGQTALVTGGSRGIGYAIAEAFVAAGAEVIVAARNAKRVEEAVEELGPKVRGLTCDIADTDQIASTVEEVWSGGGVDILVNNAGINSYYRRAEHITPADYDEVMQVNLRGTFFMTTEVARRWFAEDRRGRVVNISSTTGTTPSERLGVYGPAKAALDHVTRTMALEWADRGVRVNAVAPGWIESDMTGELFDSRHAEGLLEAIPMGRWGQPAEVAGAAVYLASEASAYTTGAVIVVDGGRALR